MDSEESQAIERAPSDAPPCQVSKWFARTSAYFCLHPCLFPLDEALCRLAPCLPKSTGRAVEDGEATRTCSEKVREFFALVKTLGPEAKEQWVDLVQRSGLIQANGEGHVGPSWKFGSPLVMHRVCSFLSDQVLSKSVLAGGRGGAAAKACRTGLEEPVFVPLSTEKLESLQDEDASRCGEGRAASAGSVRSCFLLTLAQLVAQTERRRPTSASQSRRSSRSGSATIQSERPSWSRRSAASLIEWSCQRAILCTTDDELNAIRDCVLTLWARTVQRVCVLGDAPENSFGGAGRTDSEHVACKPLLEKLQENEAVFPVDASDDRPLDTDCDRLISLLGIDKIITNGEDRGRVHDYINKNGNRVLVLLENVNQVSRERYDILMDLLHGYKMPGCTVLVFGLVAQVASLCNSPSILDFSAPVCLRL